jgi:hypothetical protein
MNRHASGAETGGDRYETSLQHHRRPAGRDGGTRTASAADWWWVAGEPGSNEVWFVDAATIMSGWCETSFSQLHLKRGGARKPRARPAPLQRSRK